MSDTENTQADNEKAETKPSESQTETGAAENEEHGATDDQTDD